MLKKVSGRATKGIVRVRVRVRRVRMMSATRGRVKTRRVKTRRVKREKVKRRRVRVRMGRATRNDVADELNRTLNLSESESEDNGIRYTLSDPPVRLRRNPPRNAHLLKRMSWK